MMDQVIMEQQQNMSQRFIELYEHYKKISMQFDNSRKQEGEEMMLNIQ